MEGNCTKIRIRAEQKSSREFENRIDESGTFRGGSKCESSSRDQRLNGILQICLEPRNPGDLLSFICPKNFIVHYFTISRNQPVKLCCRSQCPFTMQNSRTKENGQQPCARGKIKKIEENKFPRCCDAGKEIHGFPPDSKGCDSLVELDNSLRDDVKEVKDRRATCSKISEDESPRTRKRHAPEQTDSEQPWHARCSNFIVNLPVTLSGKLFGPARVNATSKACRELKDSGYSVCSEDYSGSVDRRHRRLVSKEFFEDQGRKTSDNSTEDCCSCHKDVATETQILLENGNQVKSSHSRTSRFLQDERKSCVTRRKTIPKCVKTLEDSFTEFEFADPSHRTRCSHRIKKLEKTSNSNFSNWPTLISEKFLRSQRTDPRKTVTRHSMAEKKRSARRRDPNLTDDLKVNCDGQCAVKKGRLMLKKYTISQSPEVREETLCFDVLAAEEEEDEENEIAKTRSKLRSQVRVKIGNSCQESKKKLKTIEKGDINASRKTLQKIRGESNRERNKRELDLKRARRKVEKNTSTGQIFLSNLIAKLLKGGEKSHQDREKVERGCTARNRRGGKLGASRQIRSRNVSRKYASPSINKNRNKRIKCPRNVAKNSLKNEDICCAVDSRNFPRENEARRKIPKDCSSGGRTASESEYGASYSRSSLEENIENLKNVCEKETRVMTRGETTKAKTNGEESRICESCGSSRAKGLVKSGVLQVIDTKNNCQTKSSYSMKEEEEIGGYNRRDELASKRRFGSEYKDPEDLEISQSERGPITCKRNENISISGLRTCERLIVKANEISDPVANQTSQFLAEGLRRTFVIAGENIRVKMLYDRQTSTELLVDELPVSMHCQSSKSPENGEETSSQGIINGVKRQNPDSKSVSSSAKKSPDCNLENQLEKVTRLSQGLKERPEGRECENNASKVSPEGISAREEGQVFSSLQRETCKERGEIICGSKTCLYNKALIKSANMGEEESRPGDVIAGDNPTQSPPKIGGEKEEEKEEEEAEKEKDEKRKEICERGGERKIFYVREDLRLPKLQPCETEKRKARVADGFDINKLKSRKIINAYNSQDRREASSRRVTVNEKRGKGEKINEEREKGCTLDKSVAKIRCKSYQRIANPGQVSHSVVNSVTMKNHANKSDTSETDGVEKNGEIFYDKANDDSSSNSLAPLSSSSFAFPQAIIGGASVVQRVELQDPERLETDTTVVKTSEKRGQLEEGTKRKSWSSVAKAAKSSNTKLKEDFLKSILRKGNSGRAISKGEVKGRAKGIQGKKTPGVNAGSESSNRLGRSVDIPEAKGADRSEEFGVENAKAQSSQGSEKNEEGRREDIKKLSRGMGATIRKSTFDNNKKIKENIKSKSKELGGKRVNIKKSKESAPSELSPQINSETGARKPRTSADLCSGVQIDGRNNVESYNDLQSPFEENCYSNRISASKDDASRGSVTATVLRSEIGSLGPQKTAKITAKNNIGKKTINLKAKTPPNNGGKKNSNKRIESDSASNKHDSTKSSSINDNTNVETRSLVSVNDNRNRGNNGEAESTSRRNSKQKEHLEAQHASASDNDSKRRLIGLTDCGNLAKNCITRVAESKPLAKNSSSTKTVKKTLPDSRIPYNCTKNGICLGPGGERKETAPSKAKGESSFTKPVSDSAGKPPAEEINCIKKSADPESDKKESKKGVEDTQLCFANEEKEIAQHEYDDVSEKASSSTSKSRNCKSERICNPLERDFSFTDDLKRFLDQGQEFFTFKRRRIFQRKTSYSDCENEVDDQEVKKSSETCDEDRARDDSKSSLEKAFDTLKSILGKRKGDYKSSANEGKRTKETQMCESAKDCQTSCKSKKSVESETLNSNESLTVSISFGSSIFSHRNLPTCEEKNKNCN